MQSEALLEQVDRVTGLDLSALPIFALQALAVDAAAAAQRLTALAGQAVAELHTRTGGSVPAPAPVADRAGGPVPVQSPVLPLSRWWRDASRCSGQAAGAQVRTAMALREGLPRIAAAASAGDITAEHARVLSRFVGRIDADALAARQGELLVVARAHDPVSLGKWVSHQLATWCEPVFADEQESARKGRYLQTTDNGDGSLSGRFRLAMSDCEEFLTVLESLARRDRDSFDGEHDPVPDRRNAGQRRADALLDVFALAARHADLPDTGGLPTQISYVIPADWLTATAPHRGDQAGCADRSDSAGRAGGPAGGPAGGRPGGAVVPDPFLTGPPIGAPTSMTWSTRDDALLAQWQAARDAERDAHSYRQLLDDESYDELDPQERAAWRDQAQPPDPDDQDRAGRDEHDRSWTDDGPRLDDEPWPAWDTLTRRQQARSPRRALGPVSDPHTPDPRSTGLEVAGPDGRSYGRDLVPGLTVPDGWHVATGSWTGPQTRLGIDTVSCDARTRVLVLDPIGQAVALTSANDQITRAQRRALHARDRGCTARGCSRPPAYCDAHHLVARADGGPTTIDNLVLLCRRHHRMWHDGQLTTTDLRLPWLHALTPPPDRDGP